MYGEQVPQTVETFKKAVSEGTYNGTAFFKVNSASSLVLLVCNSFLRLLQS